MLSLIPSLPGLLAFAAVHGVSALDAAGWRNQSIYQVITDRFARTDGTAPMCDTSLSRYCNGTWAGITSKLDYIQNIGATAVWISPIVKNVDGYFDGAGEAYHGFWAEDIYTLNPHFGTADDLKALSNALHARGMYLMVDIAPNHIGYPRIAGDYSNFTPFNSSSYFHKKCNINWNNLKSEQLCWLEGLPDIRTEDADVRALYAAWIKNLVTTYGIDGLRIDTALEIEPEFWTDGGIREAAGVFMLAEINHSAPTTLAPYQAYIDGFMDYSTWTDLMPAFQATSASLSAMYDLTNTIAGMTDVDPSLWGAFVENQDQVRFPYRNGDMALAKNVAALTMLRDGIPIVYYGQEQHYAGGPTPANREALWLGAGYDIYSELYGWIQQTNKIRRHAAEYDESFLTTRTKALFYRDPASASGSAGVIAFRKGQMVTMFTNGGVNAANNVTYAMSKGLTGYAANAEVIDVENCEAFTVAKSGYLHVQMPAGGLPRVFLPASQTEGLCNNVGAPVADATTLVYIKKVGQ